MSITLEEAQNLVVRYAPVLNEEYVPLAESVGRRLTSDIRSAFPQPPFDRSPLDGYAVVAQMLHPPLRIPLSNFR